MLNMTAQERRVIVFIAALALIGTGLDFAKKSFPGAKPIASFSSNIGKININRADDETLRLLPGVGKTIAARIIAYRQQKGPFKEIEELKNIQSVTLRRYEQLKDAVCIE